MSRPIGIPMPQHEMLYLLLEASPMNIRELTSHFFEEDNQENRYRMRGIITYSRKYYKKLDKYIYSVDRKYHILDKSTYAKATHDNKERIKNHAAALVDIVIQGSKDHPELKTELLGMIGNMQKTLLLDSPKNE